MMRIVAQLVVGFSVLMALAAGAGADSLVTQSFISAQTEVPGTVVSLGGNPNMVEPADLSNASSLLGVVVNSQGSYITTGAAGTLVETSGVAQTLVSNVNGDIKVGDRITASAVTGVGAKATSSARIVGIAQASLTSKTPGVTPTSIVDSNKVKHQIVVGQIPVLVGVSYYAPASTGVVATNENATNNKVLVPPGVENFVMALTGRSVPPLPLAISGFLLIVALALTGVILHAGVSSAVTAIGRNPLARTSISRNLVRVAIISAIVLLLGVGLSYLVLLVA